MKDNKKYKLELSAHGYNLYVPVNASDYHISRHVEAMKHNIYASAGVTRERLSEILAAILERCNKDNQATQWRTEIGNLVSYLQACMKSPVDELCAIRLGACLVFIEKEGKDGYCENPDQPELFYQKEKERLAQQHSELYSFFLTWGLVNSPEYRELSEVLNDTDYFRKRREMLEALLPSATK